MKSINTLVSDIYKLVGGQNVLLPSNLGADVQDAVERSLNPQPRRGLRLSGLGPTCPCALWHKINHPELEEELPPYARIKYCYGHIIEHLVIGLAKAAGHDVKGEQDELNVDGILGHRDCVIDGCIVDVKSAASRSFLKFKDGSIKEDDPFGYLDQLDAYLVGSVDDPLVTTKDRAYLLAVDKQLGHLALYEHKLREQSIRDRIKDFKRIVSLEKPPRCLCETISDGKSGNIKLGTRASYNGFKHCCFPNLRTFIYSDGPRFLTKVVRKPDVMEVDKHGRVVYH